jgi:hypothetical protein
MILPQRTKMTTSYLVPVAAVADSGTTLDTAVRAAYRMGKNDDILTHLLALNHACAEKEKAGEKITPPSLPLPPEEHAAFITTDCIEAPQL